MGLLLAPLKLAVSLALILVVAGVVAYFALRGRVTPESLAHSVGTGIGFPTGNACRERDDGWRCSVFGGSSGSDYRVRVRGRCWTARRVGPAMDGLPRRGRGCVGIWDQVRLFDRI